MRSLFTVSVDDLDQEKEGAPALPGDKRYFEKLGQIFRYGVDHDEIAPGGPYDDLRDSEIQRMAQEDEIVSRRLDLTRKFLDRHYPTFNSDERGIVTRMFLEVPPTVFDREIHKVKYVGAVWDADFVVTRLNQRTLRIRIRHPEAQKLKTATASVVSDIVDRANTVGDVHFETPYIDIREKGELGGVFKGEIISNRTLYALKSDIPGVVTFSVGTVSLVVVAIMLGIGVAVQTPTAYALLSTVLAAASGLVYARIKLRRVNKIVWHVAPDES